MKINNFSGIQKNQVSFKSQQYETRAVMTNLAQTNPAALQDLLERRMAATQGRSTGTVQTRPASESTPYINVMTNLAQTNPAALQDLLERRIAATQSRY